MPQPLRALSASTALAVTVHESSSSPRDKLPIYPPPPTPILLFEAPSPLELHIGAARRRVTHAWETAHGRVQGIVGQWVGIEEAVERRIKSIISPSESFTPGLLYVGVATLTGSILARTRTLPTRILLPPSLLVISLHHFLPATAHNLSAYFTELEETYFPSVAAKHAIARAHTRMAWEGAKETLADGRERVKGTVEGAVRGVQLATGLKLREGLGWGGEAVKVAGGGVARSVGEEAEGLAEHTKDFKPVA